MRAEHSCRYELHCKSQSQRAVRDLLEEIGRVTAHMSTLKVGGTQHSLCYFWTPGRGCCFNFLGNPLTERRSGSSISHTNNSPQTENRLNERTP